VISLAALTDPSRASHTSPAELQKLGDAVVKACHQVGFLYLCDIGIPEQDIERMWAISHEFFEGMSEGEKRAYVQGGLLDARVEQVEQTLG
jgi:isopenicillin N synthase-like dioxygenase